MVIKHNTEADYTSRQIGITNRALAKSTEKLSTSYRVNRAADDAAGLAVSEGMRGQIRGLDRGAMNTEEATGFCQVADGAMQELEDIVHRIRQLSVQSADDTNTEQDRVMIQHEIEQLIVEVERITDDTEYNTIKVFNDNSSSSKGSARGLEKVLGQSQLSTDKYGMNMKDTIDFSVGTWNRTGKEADASGGYYDNAVNKVIADINTDTGGAITSIPKSIPSSSNSVQKIVSGNYTVTVTYGNLKPDGRTRLISKVQMETYDPATGQTTPPKNYSLSRVGPGWTDGTQGYGDKTEYSCAWIDFDGLGTKYKLSDLYGEGFNTGCGHCRGENRYNIRFTGSGGDSFKVEPNPDKTGRYWYTVTVDISSCTSGSDIINRIVDAANSYPAFTGHYVQFAHENGGSKLYLYDTTPGTTTGIFNPYIVSTDSTMKEEKRALGIQVGGNSGQLVALDKPYLDKYSLGVAWVDLTTRVGAEEAMVSCDDAIDILNLKRSHMGSMVNRFGHAYDNDLNGSENIQASESLIRDLDMADEMVKYSASRIVQQAAQSMLSQANSSKDGVLALFR